MSATSSQSLSMPPMRFLFIGAAFFLRLASDSPSRRTPLPSASTSPCRVCGEFSPQGLDSTLAVTRGGRIITLKQESEHKPVRD